MRRYRVVFTKDARRDTRREVAKWRERHPKNSFLLEQEIQRAIHVLGATRRWGEESAQPQLPGVRRAVLQKSGFLLYYVVFDEQRRVALLRLWYARRGSRPKLRVVGSKSKHPRRL